jgi:hypothetical protein
MVLFFITTLLLSIVGMAALIGFKRYELATGTVFLSAVRPYVASSLERGVRLLGETLPHRAQEFFRVEGERFRTWLHLMLARGIIFVEHTLEKVLHTVREKTEPTHAPGEASAFLREVANHKKKLQRRAPEHRTIEE